MSATTVTPLLTAGLADFRLIALLTSRSALTCKAGYVGKISIEPRAF